MRLQQIAEAQPSRRDFLKTSGHIAASSMLPGGIIGMASGTKNVKAPTGYSLDELNEMLADFGEWGHIPKASAAALVSCLRQNPNDALIWSLGNRGEKLDELTNGAFGSIISDRFRHLSPTQFAKVVLDWDQGTDPDNVVFALNVLKTARDFIPALQALPLSLLNHAERDPAATQMLFKRLGLQDDQSVRKYIRMLRQYSKHKARVEKIAPGPDDYIYGSAMHQPFESRLAIALSNNDGA